MRDRYIGMVIGFAASAIITIILNQLLAVHPVYANLLLITGMMISGVLAND